MPHENIGFIGLGLMGFAMVSRLQDLDYHVTVCANKSRPNIEAAIARGAHEVETACAIARTSDIILLCMDTSASVEARMRGPNGVIAGLRKGAIVVDFGTSLPASTRALGQMWQRPGLLFRCASRAHAAACLDWPIEHYGSGRYRCV